MTSQEINEKIHELSEQSRILEEAFIENGGEITEETEEMDGYVSVLRDLLLNDGVDSLGRWLKSKEDQKAALKDEKAKIDRMIKATDRSIDYVKSLIDAVLFACKQDKAKGLLYSFTRTTSVTHAANTELIEERYHEKVEEAARNAGLPVWLKVKISPSWSLVPSDVETDEFITTSVPTVSFRKPSKTREE